MKRGSGRRRGCLIAVLLAALAFIGISLWLEYYIPAKAADLAAERLKSTLDLSRKPQITIDMHPLLIKLFTGTIDSIEVSATGIKAPEGPRITRLEAEARGIQVDMGELIRTRQPSAIKRLDEGRLRIVLSEQAVNEILAGRMPGSKVRLRSGKFSYITTLPYIGAGAALNIPGRISVKAGNVVVFTPDAEGLAALGLNQEEADYLASALALQYKVEDMPEGVTITKIKVQPDYLTIDCTIEGTDILKQLGSG